MSAVTAQPPNALQAMVTLCCDMLLDGETDWMIRRKDTIEVVDEATLRHKQSLDFRTSPLPHLPRGGKQFVAVPLGLLRKEPGRFTKFDLVDESGTSLPMPTRSGNGQLSRLVLIEAAKRVAAKKHLTVSSGVEQELRFIAEAEKDDALAIVRDAYSEPMGPFKEDGDASTRAELMVEPRLRWLIRTLAWSSVFVIELEADVNRRRVVKLSYDERVADVTVIRSHKRLAKVGALAYRFGWRGYQGHFVAPFIAARSYHFELHAPAGMQLLEAGMKGQPTQRDDRRRVHLYEPSARMLMSGFSYAQFRISGPGFAGAAALTSVAITGSLVGAVLLAPDLADSTTSAPSLLLLFPGLAASYLARPAHPLVTRLLNLARWALVLNAGAAYLAAGRLALVSKVHPANVDNLRAWFYVLGGVSLLSTLALLATRMLPLPLSGRARRAGRWILRRPGPLAESDQSGSEPSS